MKDLPNKWQKSNKSIRAVQLVFELNKPISDTIRHQANKNGISTSDQIRSVIGLQTKCPKRPRLTVSLSEEECKFLAHRYNLSPEDKTAIRQAIAAELTAYASEWCDEQRS
jgi:bacterioferritin-associated ferredoxin